MWFSVPILPILQRCINSRSWSRARDSEHSKKRCTLEGRDLNPLATTYNSLWRQARRQVANRTSQCRNGAPQRSHHVWNIVIIVRQASCNQWNKNYKWTSSELQMELTCMGKYWLVLDLFCRHSMVKHQMRVYWLLVQLVPQRPSGLWDKSKTKANQV